jgi:hypothetical protein
MSSNRIPPHRTPLPGIQDRNDAQPSGTVDAPPKTAENRLNNPARPPYHTSSTAQRFDRLFISGAASSKARQAGPARPGEKSLPAPGEAHSWFSSDYEHRFVKYDQLGQVRFMKSAPTAAAGVAHTASLKQTARLLVNPGVNDGSLDASHLDRMIEELHNDLSREGYGRQRADMERVLRSLRDDNKLQEIVNSVGAGRW